MDQQAPIPPPGSKAERAAFLALQERLPGLFREARRDPSAPRTVVVAPGLSLDPEVLAKVEGVGHYEERMLGMLMLLRDANTRVIYLTSEPIAPVVIDYYLSLLSGVPAAHACSRLVLLSAHDASRIPLTRKLLDRPRLLARIRRAISDPERAHLTVYNSTPDEVSLAVALGIPLYACDPELERWGGKSGSRQAFRDAGVPMADGAEDLVDLDQAAEALDALLGRQPDLRRAVLKIDHGFSGDGNAVVDLSGWSGPPGAAAIRKALPDLLRPEAAGMTAEEFGSLYERHGGIVEAWIEGSDKRTPSVQLRINPLREIELVSSHEQLMAGPNGQVFQGSRFPADPAYASDLHAMALRIGEGLRDRGILGRLAIDFVSVPGPDGWRHWAIEINLRKGGTTLPYQMLQYLTNGRYCAETARFITPMGQSRCYYATDNLVDPAYRRLVPQDLIDILVAHRLHFDQTRQQGLVFNLIGAMSEFGKIGVVCIDQSPEAAQAQFEQARDLLNREAAKNGEGGG